MQTLKEYVEEKECEELFSEGIVMNTVGNVLGLAGATTMYAWIAALILKGGRKAVESISKTLKGEKKEQFNKAVKEVKESPAIKTQMVKQENSDKKYRDELENVINAIKSKNNEKAAEEFSKLEPSQKNSTEVKRILIGEITKVNGYVISGTPTPGTPSFKAIRNIMGLPEAKAAAVAFEKGVQKMLGDE